MLALYMIRIHALSIRVVRLNCSAAAIFLRPSFPARHDLTRFLLFFIASIISISMQCGRRLPSSVSTRPCVSLSARP